MKRLILILFLLIISGCAVDNRVRISQKFIINTDNFNTPIWNQVVERLYFQTRLKQEQDKIDAR